MGPANNGEERMERLEREGEKNNGKWQEGSDGKYRMTRKERKRREMGKGNRAKVSEITAVPPSVLHISFPVNSQATWTSVLHCMMAPTRFLTMQR